MEENKEIKKEEETKEEVLTPSEYFDKVKDLKHLCTKEELQDFYNVAMTKFKKFIVTGQKSAARHLYNLCDLVNKEMKIIDAGFDIYVYREDVDTYINNVADDCVVAIELEDYEREIPDDIIDKISKCKEEVLFDKYYIFFTDYTGEHRSKVEEKKRAKDPIIFGSLLIEGRVSDKLFFIGDWEDDYCHLTLDKMISEMTKEYQDGASIKRIARPIMTLEEAENILNGKPNDVLVSDKKKLSKRTATKDVDAEEKPTRKKSTKSSKDSVETVPKKRGRKKRDESES